MNCLSLNQVSLKKAAEVTETIYDNGTIIYSDLSEELIRPHKRQRGSMLTIHF